MQNKSPETEERIITLEWIKENARFFVLDKKECKTMAICWIVSKQKMSGYQFYERRQWEFNPISTGRND